MSYILEALRKADAERERGAVPDLQSQLLPGSTADDDAQPRAGGRWLWPVLVLVLGGVALGLASWWFIGGQPGPTATPSASQPAAPAPAAAPSAAMAATVAASGAALPAPAPASASASASAAAAAAAAPPMAREVAPPKPDKAEAARARRAAAATAKAQRLAQARAAAKDEARAAAKADVAPPAAPAATLAVRVPRLNELPADLQRQVPALAVGGSVYSTQADKRMVILNGQVFIEGAMLTPELKLEQIRAKSAVLSIRGQRFELPL